MVPLPIKALSRQFWQTSRKVFCLKPAKSSKSLLPKNNPSDKTNWVLIATRTITDRGPIVLGSDSEKKFPKWLFGHVESSFDNSPVLCLDKLAKVFKKLFLNNVSSKKWIGFLTNLLKTSCSKSERLLRNNEELFSWRFISLRSMQFLKHLANCSLKVRQKYLQKTEPLRKCFLSNYSKVLVERNFGTPWKNFSSRPEKNAGTIRKVLQQCVLLDIYNTGLQVRKNTGKFNSNTTFLEKNIFKNVVSNICITVLMTVSEIFWPE